MIQTTEPVLSISNLNVIYPDGTWAVRDVSLSISAGSCLALVGESGCGKTTITKAVLGLLPRGSRVQGSIRVNGLEAVNASKTTLKRLRGKVVGYVAQDPYAACNPVYSVKRNVEEAWYAQKMKVPRNGVVQALTRLAIPFPKLKARLRPGQWSGGMLQRAGIAAATAHSPSLVIADEPTSALDVELADSILDLLRAESKSIFMISHDIRLVQTHSDWIAVCYAGRIVEIGSTEQVLSGPRHPYTIGLLQSIPTPGEGLPKPLPGTPPNLQDHISGCAFADRCQFVHAACRRTIPEMHDGIACPMITSA